MATPTIPPGMNVTDYQVQELEKFFTDLVTSSPLILTFTRRDAAAYIGATPGEVSGWLQRYRDVQGNKTLSSAEFTIATWNRGAGAEWYIKTWPGMTPGERETAGEIEAVYLIMTTVREEIRPMLRNVEVELTPSVLRNRRINREALPAWKTKLDSYRTMVLNLQRDVQLLTKPKMKKAVRNLNGVLTATVDEIDTWRSHLATL
jgi:hypothetical protein